MCYKYESAYSDRIYTFYNLEYIPMLDIITPKYAYQGPEPEP